MSQRINSILDFYREVEIELFFSEIEGIIKKSCNYLRFLDSEIQFIYVNFDSKYILRINF